jgi:hypothetical protein
MEPIKPGVQITLVGLRVPSSTCYKIAVQANHSGFIGGKKWGRGVDGEKGTHRWNEFFAADVRGSGCERVMRSLALGKYKYFLTANAWVSGQRDPSAQRRLAAGELCLDMQFVARDG